MRFEIALYTMSVRSEFSTVLIRLKGHDGGKQKWHDDVNTAVPERYADREVRDDGADGRAHDAHDKAEDGAFEGVLLLVDER